MLIYTFETSFMSILKPFTSWTTSYEFFLGHAPPLVISLFTLLLTLIQLPSLFVIWIINYCLYKLDFDSPAFWVLSYFIVSATFVGIVTIYFIPKFIFLLVPILAHSIFSSWYIWKKLYSY